MFDRNRITKGLAAVAALFVIGGGAALVANASSGDGSNTGAGFGPPGMQASGNNRQGMPPGAQGGPQGSLGTEATGAAADKAEAAALKQYPGTVERVVKLQDGSYVVHVERSSGEVHVLVSSEFKVQGVEQGGMGGPPPGMAPNGGQLPTPPSSGSSTN